ncbi:hypothetical protein KIL84_004127 [Mauremys mutica]|uniref:MHC class II beta chain N-terminal domain-containing protein n=1 Tax=Mauremys mutica TaxID=74926 RepID=A0A9D3XP17_9SAUR|nr:hypothetical protein KIL84_004127 [Mauremys mutica]
MDKPHPGKTTFVIMVSPLPERFLFQFKAECQFTNGTERVRYLGHCIYNQQQFVQFDSDVGVWVGETEVGRRWAEHWNKDPAEMDYRRSGVDRFCRHNYRVDKPFTVDRREAQSDSARSKMLTGVGGFVLGLIFLVPGLLIYLKNKKGRPVPQPAGLLS